MRRGLFLSILFLPLALWGAGKPNPGKAIAPVNAKPAAKAPPAKAVAQWGLVMTDGTQVYAEASFDSEVIEVFEAGKKIRMGLSVTKAIDGFGLFYKVVARPGVAGYIADVDIKPENGPAKINPEKVKSGEHATRPRKHSRWGKEQVYLSRFMGVPFGIVNFTEKFAGMKKSDQMWVTGFKVSGPGSITDAPMDFDFLVHYGAPAFYTKVPGASAKGYYFLTTAILDMALGNSKDTLLFYGLGIMASYARFHFSWSSSNFDSEEVRVGLVAALGYGFRVTKQYLVKFEARYFWEVTQYYGIQSSLQWEF